MGDNDSFESFRKAIFERKCMECNGKLEKCESISKRDNTYKCLNCGKGYVIVRRLEMKNDTNKE